VGGAGCGGSAEGGGSSSAAESASTTAIPPPVERKLRQAGYRRAKAREVEAGGHEGSPPQHSTPPIEHHDSGGGSAQFRVKGGDNSIQEFGEEASDSEREEAAAALHGFLDARAAGEWSTACSYLAATVTKDLEVLFAKAKRAQGAPKGCAAMLADLSQAVPRAVLLEAADVDVGSLRTSGSRGFILYHDAHHTDYEMPVVIEGGRWKVAAMQGSELI
jgi:hypothetical protein